MTSVLASRLSGPRPSLLSAQQVCCLFTSHFQLRPASRYRSEDFFYNRTQIGAACLEACSNAFQALYADVRFLQMRKIDLPDTFEEAIVTSEVERQNVLTREAEQQSASIRAKKGSIDADMNAKIALIQANTESNITLTMKSSAGPAHVPGGAIGHHFPVSPCAHTPLGVCISGWQCRSQRHPDHHGGLHPG